MGRKRALCPSCLVGCCFKLEGMTAWPHGCISWVWCTRIAPASCILGLFLVAPAGQLARLRVDDSLPTCRRWQKRQIFLLSAKPGRLHTVHDLTSHCCTRGYNLIICSLSYRDGLYAEARPTPVKRKCEEVPASQHMEVGAKEYSKVCSFGCHGVLGFSQQLHTAGKYLPRG